MTLKIKKLREDVIIPEYKTEGSVGFDIAVLEEVILAPNEIKVIGTGFAVEVPDGYELQIRPRSSIYKTPLRFPNSVGTIDSDYRGEVGVIVHNIGRTIYVIAKGERIAQGILAPIVKADIQVVDDLTETKRGAGGFGSTGK